MATNKGRRQAWHHIRVPGMCGGKQGGPARHLMDTCGKRMEEGVAKREQKDCQISSESR